MYGQFDLITLIALIVAVAAILKLRSVLGHRSDEDEQRVERLKRESARRHSVRLPKRRRPTSSRCRVAIAIPCNLDRAVEAPANNVEARIKAYSVVDPSITNGLLEIANFDPALDPEVVRDRCRPRLRDDRVGVCRGQPARR